MAGIDFLAQSLRNLLSVSEVMWSCNEAKRDLRRARRKCQQQAKMNLWHELESLRQYTWHLEWVIHNLEQQLAQSQGADSESEQSLAQVKSLGLRLEHVDRSSEDAIDEEEEFVGSPVRAKEKSQEDLLSATALSDEDEAEPNSVSADQKPGACSMETPVPEQVQDVGVPSIEEVQPAPRTQLVAGTRVRVTRDVSGWFDYHNWYFVDKGWEGLIIDAAKHDWDSKWFLPDVDYVYVRFRNPPDKPRDGFLWDTLDGQCYYAPCGVKLAVRARDVEILP